MLGICYFNLKNPVTKNCIHVYESDLNLEKDEGLLKKSDSQITRRI